MRGQRHAGISQFLGVHYAPVPKRNRLDSMCVVGSTDSSGKSQKGLLAISYREKQVLLNVSTELVTLRFHCVHRETSNAIVDSICSWETRRLLPIAENTPRYRFRGGTFIHPRYYIRLQRYSREFLRSIFPSCFHSGERHIVTLEHWEYSFSHRSFLILKY